MSLVGSRAGAARVRCAPVLCVWALLVWSARDASAQERPSEADMFGGSAPAAEPETAPAPGEATPPAAAQAAPAATSSGSRDAQILGSSPSPMFTGEAAPEDPLSIGGQLYLRTLFSGAEGQNIGDYAFSSPALLDVFLDVRPNDRVRGFVLTRMQFDPSVTPGAPASGSLGTGAEAGGVGGSQELSSLFAAPERGPRLVLDQLWLRFDLAHTVFVTAGTQHVRWGTGRFWAPTDYLHLQRRDPLAVFDARTGTTMLKLHVPIESQAWNFYGYILTESEESTSTLDRIAGAARAEIVLGPAELGLGVFARRGQKLRYAADLSFGIGDFDLYSELAVRDAGEVDRVHFAPEASVPPLDPPPPSQTPDQTSLAELSNVIDAFYPAYRKQGLKPQVVAGLTYARKYNDNDTWSLGAEYFYNGLGYGSPVPYPGLVLPHSAALKDPATFFYLGKVYGAIFLNFPSPYSLDNHSFTLSTLGNLSDRSFITRFDYGLILLTHLRFEAFVAARYGHINGEFRFGAEDLELGGFSFDRAPGLLDFGMALRVDI
jgi:hypothetical protein